MMKQPLSAVLCAILAAALYAVNIPLSKMLLAYIAPAMLAAFLYLGAGVGLAGYRLVRSVFLKDTLRKPLTKQDLPFVIAMVALDIAAPILLMSGISLTSSANASLLNNFEIVATSLVAWMVFREKISGKLWLSIALITFASVLLGFEGFQVLVLQKGSVLVLAACLCWGFENNCTRRISGKSSVDIVIIKGCFSGLGSLVVALLRSEAFPPFKWLLLTLALGFVAYGLSIRFYILAQRDLGAARTSAYYSIAPFLGVGFSMLLLGERPDAKFYAALAIMFAAAVLLSGDTLFPRPKAAR